MGNIQYRELVIKISEEIYDRFGHEYSDENLISKDTNDAILEAFCNGTPLPKGHGRLGDLDALETEMTNGIKAGNYEKGYENYGHILNMDDCVECVRYAETIVEVDKEEKNGRSR